MSHPVQWLATVLFAAAIFHTFATGKILEKAHASAVGSTRANLFHILGEVEIVFGLWAAIFVALYALIDGPDSAIAYVQGVDFTEAAFVFVIMAVAATRPIRALALRGIELSAAAITRAIPRVSVHQAFYFVTLVLGPLLGSLLTEPAAMTVCALILKERFFAHPTSVRFRYKTLALLFVNISIGGVLTHFAAPPVVMVAHAWNWDTSFMFTHFGYKAMIAVILNAAFTIYILRVDFAKLGAAGATERKSARIPLWVTFVNIGFLFLVVYCAHYLAVFLGLFMLFVGVTTVTAHYQDPLKLRESMLVGFFLAGLVVLGKPQAWWLAPFITSLGPRSLYLGATALTAVTDNAALTFLGSQVPNLAPALKYALVAGAVTGGGLTVIANAPNPAGYGLLKSHFGPDGIRPGRLLQAAVIPTLIAALCLELL